MVDNPKVIQIQDLSEDDIGWMFSWCRDTFGDSSYTPGPCYYSVVEGQSEDGRCGECAWDETPVTCYIWPEEHGDLDLLDLCGTVIHEYTHYLQQPDEYYTHAAKDQWALDNPLEIEAYAVERDFRELLYNDFLNYINGN